MTEEQAGWVTIREFLARQKAYEKKNQEEWERARWQMFLVMQMHPNIKKAQKPGSPTAWIRFPWENPAEGITAEDCHVNEEQQEQLDELLQNFINRKRK